MAELPYANLVSDDEGRITGVECPVCHEVLPTTDPVKAAYIYADHLLKEHGINASND